MLKKTIALLIGVLLIAGCSSAPAAQSSSSSEAAPASSSEVAAPEAEYVPEYKYKNPDPDMVMITAPDGDVTYKDYRLYLDVAEAMSRYSARQNIAVCYLLERDLKEMGVEINEEEYNKLADEQLMSTLLYSPSLAEDIKTIAEATGMTEKQANEAMKFSSRTQYLVSLLGDEFQRLAAEKYVAPTEDKNAVEGETAEEAAARREAEKLSAIYDMAMADLNEYSAKYDAQLDFSNDKVLASLNGTDIPLTEEYTRFVDYSGVAARVDAISFIQAGELSMRALEGREAKLDTDAIMADYEQQVAAMRASAPYMEQLKKFCEPFGATCDDYFDALKRPIILQSAGDLLYADLVQEFEKLAAEGKADDLGETADEYYVNTITELVAKSEIANISGK